MVPTLKVNTKTSGIKSSEINTCTHLTRELRILDEKKIVFSKNSFGKRIFSCE